MSPRPDYSQLQSTPLFLESLEPRLLLTAWYPGLQTVVAPADNPALQAGMDVFLPPVNTQTPVSGAPQIGEWTRTGEGGDVMALTGWQLSGYTGSDFGKDTRFYAWRQSDMLDGELVDVETLRLDTDNIQAAVRLAEDAGEYSMLLLWAQNSSGVGYPVAINQTEAWWGSNAGTRGDTVSVFGRNLSYHDATYEGTNTAWVYLKPSVGSGTWAEVTAANPYKVDYTVPAGLSNGTYEVWVHNGHGGDYGWSKSPSALTVSDPVTWTGTIRNVMSYGATGDGVTDDSSFIQAAVSACQAGDQLYFPAGTYLSPTSFTVPSGVRTYGDGAGTTMWKATKVTFGGNSRIENLAFEGQQGIAANGAYVWMDRISVHETGWLDYSIISFTGSNHIYLTNSTLIGKHVSGFGSQTFIDNCDFYARYDTEDLIEAWACAQLSVTNNTFQHYDMSNPSHPSGWGEGRAWVGYCHWGSQTQQYFGGNETVDFVVRTGGGDQNSGEQLLWEGSYPFYNGTITGATSNTITFNPGATPPATNMRVVITGGKGLGQVRQVASYDGGTYTTTVTQPWNVIPDTTSTVLLVRTFDKIAVYDNYFDGTQLAVDQTAHVANSGVNTFYGGINFVVDNNYFHEMRSGVVWTPGGGTSESAVNYSQYVANNTFDYVRWATSVSGGTMAHGETQLLNVFRDNVVINKVADVAFKTGKAVLNVYDSNQVLSAHKGFLFSSAASDNIILYNNTLEQGDSEYAASVGINFGSGAGSLFMQGNSWTGFQTSISGTAPGATVELPRRVVVADVAAGASTQVEIPLWNAGLANLGWSITDDAAWLGVAPSSGSLSDQSAPQGLTLTCDAASLTNGSYTGTITVTDGSQTMKVTVLLTVGLRPTVAGYSGPAVLGSGSQITVTGTNFVNGCEVRIGGTAMAGVTFNSSTQLTVTLPAMAAADGIYSLEVVNPNELSAVLDGGVAYGRYLSSCTPDNAHLNGGVTITVFGAGFEATTTFSVNGSAATNVTIVSSRQATFTVPAGGTTVGLATIAAATGGNTFGGSPKFGYHATYVSPWFGDAGVAALKAKAANPAFADYVQPILDRAEKHLSTGLINSFDSNGSVIVTSLYGYLLTGKPEYRDRLMREVDYVANTIGWVSQQGQVAVGRVTAMAEAYNALAAELTATERGWFEGYFSDLLTDDEGTWGWYGNPGSNTVVVAAGVAGMSGLVMKHTMYTESVYAINWAVDLLENSYIDKGFMVDGGCPEGSLYWDYGFGYYLYFAKALEQATGSHQGLLTAPSLSNMRDYVEFLLAGDKVTGMQSFGDTQPFLTGFTICADFGARFNDGLYRWLADEMASRIAADADGLISSYYRNNLDVRDPYVAWGFLWRDATASPSSFPTIATKVVLDNNTQGVTIRTDGSDFYPDMVVSAIGGHRYGHHKQYDKGSFVVQANEEAYLIDPGYFQGNASDGDQTVHSIPLIDGNGVTDSNTPMATILSSFENAAAGYRGFVMDTTDAYANGAATRAHRVFVMTQQELQGEALILLDDIVASGSGVVTAQYQAGFAASTIDGGLGAVIQGNNGRMLLRTFGPAASLTATGPTDFEGSWYFDRMGVQWYKVRGDYTANANTPLVTVMLPLNDLTGDLPVAGADYSVTYGSGTITVNLPGGAKVNFTQVGGAWEFTSYEQPATQQVSLITIDPDASEENEDGGRFMVYRTGPTGSPLTVSYSLSGTAASGDYYESLTGSVTIPANERYVYIDVTPIDDAAPEIDEYLTLTLLDTANYDLAYPETGTITLADNDTRTFHWIGGTGSWSTYTNWDLGEVPGPNDVAVFSSGASVTLDTQDETVGWVTIDSLNSFSILGTYKLILSNGTLNVNARSGKTHTITCPVSGTASGVNFFGGGTYAFGNTLSDFTGPISISGGTFLYSTAGADTIFGNSANDLTLGGGVLVSIGTNGGDFNPASGRTVTIGEGGATFYANSDDIVFDDADQLQGSGLVTLRAMTYGTQMHLSAAQPNFSGGFLVDHVSGQRRVTELNATVAGALGTGPVTVRGIGGLVSYTWGAQTAVGGVTAGITAEDHGTINLVGTWSSTPDRFTVSEFGQIRGSSAQLGSVYRVSSFSGSPTTPEAILSTGAVVCHTTVSTSSIQNLGTAHDLLFGLGNNFNDPAFTLNIGNGSPWMGIARQTSAFSTSTSEVTRRLQQGTINVDGSNGFTEMVFLSAGNAYGSEERLLLGLDTYCPTFVLTGGNKVVGRVLDGQGRGRFVLDSSAPAYSNAISEWIVGDGTRTGEMMVTYTGGLGGIPVTVQSGSKLTASVTDALNANVTVNTGGTLVGPVTVASGLRLSGGGAVSGSVTVASGGTIAPGSATGAMSITGDLTLENGATYECSLGDTVSDSISVSGVVTLPYGGSTWTLKLVDDGGFVTEDHVLFTFSGTAPDLSGVVLDYGTTGWSGCRLEIQGASVVLTGTWTTVTLEATDTSAHEQGTDTGSFTVTRTGTSGDLTVHYTVGGTAGSGDYTPTLTGSVVIPDGQSSVVVTVTPVDDQEVEGPETLILTLAKDDAYARGAVISGTVTIGDNDGIPTVTLSATDSTAAEAGLATGAFTVTRSFTGGDLTVYYTIGGSATNGSDYVTLTGSVVIPSGQNSAVITVTPIDDDEIEGSESVSVQLASDAAYQIGSPYSGVVNITSDDKPVVSITATDASGSEAGNGTMSFRISRSGPGDIASGDLVVMYGVSGNASAGDYSETLGGTITIPDGELYADIVVTPVNDGAREGHEQLKLTLTTSPTYTLGAPNSATGRILDDDFSAATVTWTNGGGDGLASNPNNWSGALDHGVDVLLDGTSTADLVWDVTYNIDDWTQTSAYTGTVTIGTTYSTFSSTFTTFYVSGNVDLQGGKWTHIANTKGYSESGRDEYRLNAMVYGNLTVASGVSIDVTSKGYVEGKPNYNGGGTHGGRSSYPATPYDDPFMPLYHGTGGGSVSATNFSGGGSVFLVVNGTSTINGSILANVDAPTATYSRAAAGGSVYLETGSLSGSGAIETAGGNSLGGSNTNNGGGGRLAVILTGSASTFANFTGTLSAKAGTGGGFSAKAAAGSVYKQAGSEGPRQGELVIDFANRYGDTVDDYAYQFLAEDMSKVQVTMRQQGLWKLMGNTVIGGLDMASGTNLLLGGYTLTINSAPEEAVFSGTIYLDAAKTQTYDPQVGSSQIVFTRVLRPTVTIEATDPIATEAGPTTGTFTVTRTGPTSGDLVVRYTVGGTASSGDYSETLSGTITIPDGQASATITITPVDDSAIEPDETLVLTLSADAAYNVGSPAGGTVTIVSDDLDTVTLTATDASATEAGPTTGTFTVTRTATQGDLTVNYTIAGTATNTSDYATLSGSVVIPDGQTSATITVTPVDDSDIEADETVLLTLASGGYSIGSPASDTVTIVSDDVPTVTITATDATATEAGQTTGTFTVTRSGSGPALTSGDLTVNYTIAGTATNTTDYSTLSGSVTIPDGQANAVITITPVDDSDIEADETVLLTLASGGYSIGSPASDTVTIVSDDVPTVAITATDATATEAGQTTGTFTVTRSGSGPALTSGDLTVNYTIAGTATNTSDYATLSGSVVIPDGQTSATITVTPVDDSDIEADETVVLTLASGGYSIGSPASDTVTIVSDDVPSVSIVATDSSASETGPDTGTFTVTRSGSGPALTSGDLTVNYTIGGTATNTTDYATLSGSVVIPDGQASATITVTPVDDAETEADETVLLTVASGSGYTVGSPDHATVDIADNDGAVEVNLTATDAFASETGPDDGVFTITRTGTSGDLTVNYTVSGLADSGDYSQTLTGSVVIPNGQGSTTITITPVNDSVKETDEPLTLTLASGTGYTIGANSEATVVIEDNDVPAGTAWWVGQGDDTLASNPYNWAGDALANGVDIALDATSTKDLYWDVTYTVSDWAQASGYTGTVTIPTTYSAYSATFTVMSITGDLEISGGTWTQELNGKGYSEANPDQYRLRVDVGGNLTIGSGGAIDVTSKGYRPGYPNYNGGASHGGLGGTGSSWTGGPVYDSIFAPTLHGMGGGSTSDWQHEGGGSVYLTVAGSSTINGSILANVNAPLQTYTRAGAGGSVYLSTASISGSGSVAAKGGDSTGGSNTGDGGGGRIAVVLTGTGNTFSGYTGSFNAQPGTGGASSAHASAGTIYLQTGDQASGEGQVIIDSFDRNGDTVDDQATVLTSEDLSGSELLLRQKGIVKLTGNQEIGALDMAGGTQLALNGYTLTINQAKSQATLNGTIYLDAPRTQTYDPQQGHAQVVWTVSDTPTVTLTATDASAAEESSETGQFTVTRDQTSGDLTVYYSIGGTATNTSDYATLTGSVVIADGNSSAVITVTPVDDADHEGDETVVLTLSTDAAYTIGTPSSDTVTIADDDPAGPKLLEGVVTTVSNTGWTTVNLANDYNSMVVVCTVVHNGTLPPIAARVQNASGNSFQVRVDRADGQTGDVTGITVHYMVVEEGVYTVANDGVKMEAVKYTSTVTDRKSSWNGQSRTYANSYTTPVVLGQVMSYNDTDWSVFWCRGTSSSTPPTSTTLRTGKHVGEDSDTTRSDETIGYIVIESGSGTINGVDYVAALGADTVQGISDTPPYSYTISGFATVSSATVSQNAMDGADGGWAMLYGPAPVTTTDIDLAVNEDMIGDSERNHTTEQLGYMVFGQAAMQVATAPTTAEPTGVTLSDAPSDDLVQTAIADWEAALNADLSQLLAGVRFVITDLGGSLLAYEDRGVIYLDDDAAGYGWFIDETPLDNAEFTTETAGGLSATDTSPAAGAIDLLTVLRHELGHVLGVAHEDPGSADVMSETLEAGTRKLFDTADEEVVDLLALI